jgi:hypothetical protein
MKKLFTLCVIIAMTISIAAQSPQKMSYQAVIRNASGVLQANQAVGMRISILQGSETGTPVYVETQSKTTNANGLVTLEIGSGTIVSGTFSGIDWSNGTYFIKTETDPTGGTNYTITGTSQILSVPYALYSKIAKTANYNDLTNKPTTLSGYGITDAISNAGTQTISGETTLKGTTPDLEAPLFEVKNKDGQTILAVYNEGVRIWVADGAKGTKGGFAVGGFDMIQKYFDVNPDSVRIYIDSDPTTTGLKGGFAVGGYDKTRGTNTNYLNVNTDSKDKINPAQNRMLWYPLLGKNAFLVGRVLIRHPDSIGVNSVTTGYESMAKGMYSQAFGFQSIARGNYSTAIGKNAIAHKENSFAFGNDTKALGKESYAFGTGAIASGEKSFALGSSQLNDSTGVTVHTVASSYGAFALGFGSVASNIGAFAVGVLDTASGILSNAMGYFTKSHGIVSTTLGVGTEADNYAASAFGDHSYASGHTSFATGFKTIASGHLASTFGDQTKASGYASTALGYLTTAQSSGSLAIGAWNIVSGSPDYWYPWDPLFVIGNGTSSTSRSNAMTVYKNGNADLGGHLNLNNYINLNRGATGVAMYVSDDEALWYDGTTYSWGFGGKYNVFADNVSVGTTGTNATYTLYVSGNAYSTGTFFSASDIRWKKNISQMGSVLDKVIQLDGVNYEWRNDEFPEIHFDSGMQIGLIAQQVEKIFPELVKTDDIGYKAVSYEKLTVILLEAMKEQQKQIESYKSQLQSLQDKVDRIEVMLAKGGGN